MGFFGDRQRVAFSFESRVEGGAWWPRKRRRGERKKDRRDRGGLRPRLLSEGDSGGEWLLKETEKGEDDKKEGQGGREW